MKFSCDSCGAAYMISDDKVGPGGVKVRCKKCGNVVTVKRAEEPPVVENCEVGGPAGAAGSGAGAAGLSPKAWSKALPSSSSSPCGAAGAVRSSIGAAGASSARRTVIWFPHFLQRTFTPFGPTFSSEMM